MYNTINLFGRKKVGRQPPSEVGSIDRLVMWCRMASLITHPALSVYLPTVFHITVYLSTTHAFTLLTLSHNFQPNRCPLQASNLWPRYWVIAYFAWFHSLLAAVPLPPSIHLSCITYCLHKARPTLTSICSLTTERQRPCHAKAHTITTSIPFLFHIPPLRRRFIFIRIWLWIVPRDSRAVSRLDFLDIQDRETRVKKPEIFLGSETEISRQPY